MRAQMMELIHQGHIGIAGCLRRAREAIYTGHTDATGGNVVFFTQTLRIKHYGHKHYGS